jgi:hypothetical protein
MPKYKFNTGYILLNRDSNKLVFLQQLSKRGCKGYEEVLIADMNRTHIQNDYELMELFCKKMFFYHPEPISKELKNYKHTLNALKKGASIEVLDKKAYLLPFSLQISFPSATSTEEKSVYTYDVPQPDLNLYYMERFNDNRYVSKHLKPLFQKAMLEYDKQMEHKFVIQEEEFER